MPTLYIRDKDTRIITHVEESFSSLIWTERYQEAGDFVLDIPLDAIDFSFYKRGNYISMDESRESMIIEKIEITEQMESPVVEISGRSASILLDRRVNASRVFDVYSRSIATLRMKAPVNKNSVIRYSGTVSDILKQMFDEEISNPTLPYYSWWHKVEVEGATEAWRPGYDAELADDELKIVAEKNSADYRKIPGFGFESLIANDSKHMTKEFSEIKTLYDMFIQISKENLTGFRSIIDSNNNIIVQVYKGNDRTVKQNVLDPLIFSPIMDNISYINYMEDSTDYKTTGFAYSDSGISYYRKTRLYDPIPYNTIYNGYNWTQQTDLTGYDRYEIPFNFMSDISISQLDADSTRDEEAVDSDPDDEIEEKVSSWAEYYDKIQQKIVSTANDKYDEGGYEIVKTSEGSIDPLARYTFDEDYFMGDIVEIFNSNGTIMTAIIDEVVRSYDSDGFIITPNFKNMIEYDYGEEDA